MRATRSRIPRHACAKRAPRGPDGPKRRRPYKMRLQRFPTNRLRPGSLVSLVMTPEKHSVVEAWPIGASSNVDLPVGSIGIVIGQMRDVHPSHVSIDRWDDDAECVVSVDGIQYGLWRYQLRRVKGTT